MTHINEARELLAKQWDAEDMHYNAQAIREGRCRTFTQVHLIEQAISEALSQRAAALTASQEQQAEIERLKMELSLKRPTDADVADVQRMRQEYRRKLRGLYGDGFPNELVALEAKAKRHDSAVAERDRYKAALEHLVKSADRVHPEGTHYVIRKASMDKAVGVLSSKWEG